MEVPYKWQNKLHMLFWSQNVHSSLIWVYHFPFEDDIYDIYCLEFSLMQENTSLIKKYIFFLSPSEVLLWKGGVKHYGETNTCRAKAASRLEESTELCLAPAGILSQALSNSLLGCLTQWQGINYEWMRPSCFFPKENIKANARERQEFFKKDKGDSVLCLLTTRGKGKPKTNDT